jgi:hypothetical protein
MIFQCKRACNNWIELTIQASLSTRNEKRNGEQEMLFSCSHIRFSDFSLYHALLVVVVVVVIVIDVFRLLADWLSTILFTYEPIGRRYSLSTQRHPDFYRCSSKWILAHRQHHTSEVRRYQHLSNVSTMDDSSPFFFFFIVFLAEGNVNHA